MNRARLLHNLEYYEASAREARVALCVASQNVEAMGYLADYEYYVAWAPLEAFKLVRNALVLRPGTPELQIRLALIYEALGEEEKSLKTIESVTRRHPKFSKGWYTKALIFRGRDTEKALAAAREAVTLAEKHPRYQELLGDILKEDGQDVAALKAWKDALLYDSADAGLQRKVRDAADAPGP
jgi:tetratricopeptide (TPR) repeat protein